MEHTIEPRTKEEWQALQDYLDANGFTWHMVFTTVIHGNLKVITSKIEVVFESDSVFIK